MYTSIIFLLFFFQHKVFAIRTHVEMDSVTKRSMGTNAHAILVIKVATAKVNLLISLFSSLYFLTKLT